MPRPSRLPHRRLWRGASAAECAEATKVLNDGTTQITAAAAGDLKGLDKSLTEMSEKFKKLAGNAEGEVAVALNELATGLGDVKIDASDPAGAVTALTGLTTTLSESGTKLANACG